MIKFKKIPTISLKIVFADSKRETIIKDSVSVGYIADLINKYNREGIAAKIYYKKESNWLLIADYE